MICPKDGELLIRPNDGLFMYPLLMRYDTSDPSVFHQVFHEKEYDSLSDMTDVCLVMDCGANVGYSAAWFLTKFTGCHVIAVEPDPGNFDVLVRNMEPYGDRVTLVNGGVWSCECFLSIDEDSYESYLGWSRQVRLAKNDGRPMIPGITIGNLLYLSGYHRIDILKMDIEGSEVEVFSADDLSWLASVRSMAVELHDHTRFGCATDVFYKAIADRGFSKSQHHEFAVCRRQ